ncbi:TRAP-type C4-dicarboxylate transport system, periplasmic component [Bacillus sp. OxB-1]|uniref:TRAP transporter substrate-binding protein n=1 Tax=Bacillus sp. (strain OxB-1) TaxID=98228 RepID=UPI0005823943|nr:TRAP transporter substrate-binding protein [Bacillus sp. OxB-1]BAQ09316.1 TRAP-type C4-dicarboxylate transport system, periplasmic component [Bacillus sp. OxB-1]
MSFFKKMKSVAFVSVLALAAMLAACGNGGDTASSDKGGDTEGAAAGEKYTFKISHVTQESHIWHKTAEKFGEELKALSDGRMDVEIYPASQLGQEKDMVQQLETGSLDFGFLTNAYMSTRQDSLNAWFMPFVFNNLEEANELRSSDAAKQMLEELSSQSLVGMDFIFAGNRHVLLKSGTVESPADLAGKKIRIIGSPSMQSFWEKTGAGPTAMPLPEVYTSLQTGVIDGIDIDLDALVTEKYYENAENLTLTNHMTFPAVIVMGQPSYDKLSAEDQEIVKEAMQKAVDWGIQESIAREESNLQTLKDSGVNVVELTDSSAFDAISQEVRDEYSAKSDVIKSFLEAAAK